MKYKDYTDPITMERWINGTYVGVKMGGALGDAQNLGNDGHDHLRSSEGFGTVTQDKLQRYENNDSEDVQDLASESNELGDVQDLVSESNELGDVQDQVPESNELGDPQDLEDDEYDDLKISEL